MDAAALMEKLEGLIVGAEETERKARKLAHGAMSRAHGIEQAKELVQQHLHRAAEIAVQEEAATDDVPEEIAPIVYLGYDPDSDDAPEGHGYLCRDAKGNRYLTGVVWGIKGATHEAQDDAPADSAEDIAEVAEMTAAFMHEDEVGLSFTQLAEAAKEQVEELLRRRQEQYTYAQDGAFQEELEAAVEVLAIAMMPEDNSHLADDDEAAMEDIPVLECDSHLTFEELAEDLHVGARELLRRCMTGDSPNQGQCHIPNLRKAVRTLKVAMWKGSSPDPGEYPDIDEETPVIDGGAPMTISEAVGILFDVHKLSEEFFDHEEGAVMRQLIVFRHLAESAGMMKERHDIAALPHIKYAAASKWRKTPTSDCLHEAQCIADSVRET